ncbi:proline racemase family protein, partial [Bacillus cereus]
FYSRAGEVIAYATYNGSEVLCVSFEIVPSFVFKKDVPIKIDDYEFQVDIACGGAFYAVLDCKDFGLKVYFKDLSAIQA